MESSEKPEKVLITVKNPVRFGNRIWKLLIIPKYSMTKKKISKNTKNRNILRRSVLRKTRLKDFSPKIAKLLGDFDYQTDMKNLRLEI